MRCLAAALPAAFANGGIGEIKRREIVTKREMHASWRGRWGVGLRGETENSAFNSGKMSIAVRGPRETTFTRGGTNSRISVSHVECECSNGGYARVVDGNLRGSPFPYQS